MYVSVLAARPLPMVLKSGGGNVGWQDEEDAGPAAEVIAALEDFADRVDWPLFRDAMGEPLVNAIAAAFTDDDVRILVELSRVIEGFAQGLNARDILAEFLFNTSSEGNTGSSRVAASRVTRSARARDIAVSGGSDAAYRRTFATSRKLQEEFDSADTYVAYCRASHAGRVHLCAATRKALVSMATPVTREQAAADAQHDAEFERVWAREYAGSRALQDEFGSVETYIAYRSAQRRGLVKIAERTAR